MKRRNLFLIGVLSAIVTIMSLNFAFGSTWHYERHRYYDCHERSYHDGDRNNSEKKVSENSQQNNY